MKRIKTKPSFKIFIGLSLAFTFTAMTNNAMAVDWDLASRPLYLGNQVPPNVLFVIDDSGSMDWEIMSKDLYHDGLFTGTQPDGTNPASSGSVKHRDSDNDGIADCSFSSGTYYGYLYGVEFGSNRYGDGSTDCNTADDQAWRFRNHDFNPLYFDPTKTYRPWPGTREDGTAFGNIDIHNAPDDPWKSTPETIDLTCNNSSWLGGVGNSHGTSDRDGDLVCDGFYYYTWTDNNHNDLFDNGEETEHLIKNESAAVQQNFANWFSYYRSRDLVAKGAFGTVIGGIENMRMGVATIHNNNTVNTPLKLMNLDPTTGYKKILLDNLYQFDPNGGTPTRYTYKNAGKYLSGQTNSLFPSNEKAPLPADQGGACQQNFTLLMTDGFYNGNYSDTNPRINNADGDNNTDWDGGAYADTRSQTLADIAMYYYENDLIPTVTNAVPVIPGVDEATHQHMVTYTIAFGVNGTLTDMPADPKVAFAWPNPTSGDAQKIDDMRHAAYNGRGEFLEAEEPDKLVSALSQALSSIIARTSASAALAFNSTTIRTDTLAFQGRYLTTDWTGDLLYMPVSNTGTVQSALVNASDVLTTMTSADRNIISYHPVNKTGIPFQWANLDASQQTLLNDTDSYGQYRLEYLRGDKSCEVDSTTTCATPGKIFRNRSRNLGDVVNSEPNFVGTPNGYYNFDNYDTFITAKQDRTPVVYVGANDGMLHGFDASINTDGTKTATTGEELIAYVPSLMFNKLSKLTNPIYLHEYFVDGSPVTNDVYYGGNWHTALVSGLGAGGQGVFALDVTDPGNFKETSASSLVLWEFGDTDDKDLGYTFGKPTIVKMANGSWAAIFSNGYNNTESDGNVGSGTAVLYIVDINTKTVLAKLDTGVGNGATYNDASQHGGLPNGLSAPTAVDVDGDFVADFIYAGDLYGNMWRFDVTDNSAANWKVSFSNVPLFTAKNADNKYQPITTKPVFTTHPDQSGYMIYFGTGKYIEQSDNSAIGQDTQSFYGLWDKVAKGSSTAFSAFSRSDLLQQQILEEVSDGNGNIARVTSGNTIDWSVHHGWYMDLINTDGGNTDNQGERQVTEPLYRNGKIIFTTLIPSVAVCTFGGTGWVMQLNASDGGRLAQPVFDLNNDGAFNNSDLLTSAAAGGAVAVSGLKSQAGILSAPALITGESGLTEYLAISNTMGTVGLGGVSGGGDVVGDPTDPDNQDALTTGAKQGGESVKTRPVIPKGRVLWKQIK